MRRKFILITIALVLLLAPLAIAVADGEWAVRMEYDASDNPIYIGKALPGTAGTASAWQLKYLTYDASGNCIAIQYAGGTEDFLFKWTLRASYTYE